MSRSQQSFRVFFRSVCAISSISAEAAQAVLDSIENSSDLGDIPEYLSATIINIAANTAVNGLRFASTSEGWLGLFPPLISKGDIVGFVKDCAVPVVLCNLTTAISSLARVCWRRP